MLAVKARIWLVVMARLRAITGFHRKVSKRALAENLACHIDLTVNPWTPAASSLRVAARFGGGWQQLS